MFDSLGTIYAEIRLKFDDLKKDITTASTEIKQMESEVKDSMGGMTDMGNSLKSVGGAMSKYVTAPIVALGTASVYTGAQFDTSMSKVKALAGVTGDEFEKLRAQARDLGRDTKFTATEAAEGMSMLALAGFDVDEIMATMPGMLSLAAAGALELDEASTIVADTLHAFGESADNAQRYADVFAKAAVSGNTDVRGLGEAMSYGALTAASMGMSVEEASAIMTIFADAGMKGSRAGTSFEAMMRDLRKSAIESGGALEFTTAAGEDMSVAWYDAQGNTREFVDILGDLESALGDATDEERDFVLGQLVNTQAMRGLNAVLSRGSDYLGDLTGSLVTAGQEGKASGDMADDMLDNLAGSLTILKSAIAEVFIGFSDVMAPVIRAVADGLKNLAVWFGKLPHGMKVFITVILALVAAIGPILMIFGVILTMIPAMVAGWGILTGAFTAVIAPVLGIVAGIAALITAGVLLVKNWDKIKEFASTLWQGMKDGWNAIVEGIKNLFQGIGEFFVNLWEGIKETFSTAFTAIIDWFVSLPSKIAEGVSNFVSMVVEGVTTVVEWFVSLPEKVTSFLTKLFIEDIPYWIGFAIGTMIRVVKEGIENTITFFSELPGKVLEFLQNVWEYTQEKWTEVKETMIDLVTTAIDNVVTFFSELPGKVLNWLQKTWENVSNKFNEMKETMINRMKEAVDKVVEWVQGLPNRIWEWLVNTKNKVVNFGSEAWTAAKEAGQKIVDGMMSTVKGLPGLVWDALMGVKNNIASAASNLWSSAKSAASSLWSGFKNGLGIRSPSYLEEAMFDIMDASKDLLDTMKGDFRALGHLKVNPPSLGGYGDKLATDMADIAYLFGDDTDYTFSGKDVRNVQVIEHKHSGELEVRGVNDKGELIDVVQIVRDELEKEVRK